MSSSARRPNSMPATPSTTRSARAETAVLIGRSPDVRLKPDTGRGDRLQPVVRASRAPSPQLGRDRGQHLVQVADDRVVGDRHDRRLRVGVDREDPLRALGSRRCAGSHRRRRRRCRCRARSCCPSARPDPCAGASRTSSPPASSRPRRRAGRRAPRPTAKPSAEPTPRPPVTTTFASASETPPAGGATRSRTRTTRSASASSGVNVSTEPGRAGLDGGDRVRRDRQERAPGVQPRLLEQAAAPADARQRERVAGRHRRAVRRQRLAEAHGRARHRVGGGGRPGRDDRGRADAIRHAAEDRRPGVGRERVERVVLGDVGHDGRHALRRLAPPGPIRSACVSPPRPAASASACSETSVATPSACSTRTRFIDATPICSRSSTTAAAASGPRPSTSACFASPSGTTSRERSSREAGRAGVVASSGLRPARIRPGHRRVARQVQPLEHGHAPRAAAARRRRGRRRPPARSGPQPPSTTTLLSPVAQGRPSAYATRRPTW